MASISTPASAGPMSRAPFIKNELSAIALPKSSRRSTVCGTNACRPGMSKALIAPSTAASASNSQALTAPDIVRTVSTTAWTSAQACVITNIRRNGQRSTSTPVMGANSRMGTCAAKPSMPRRKGESVSR